MSNRTLKNSTFCVLPFIEKFQNLDGNTYFCCHSRVPIGTDADDLRSKILNNQPIAHCEICYTQEKQNIVSIRQIANIQWLRDPEVKNYIDTWQPGDKLKTYFYDIRFNNKCNLACVGCNPNASSLWARELDVKVVDHSLNFDINKALGAKQVYLAGGEPLIIDQFIDFIIQLSQQEQQPELVINTNLTRVNDELKNTLALVKNLTLVVSIDAYGSVNEYHRWPMSWKKLIDNLEWAKSINCTIQFNTVADAVSILNLQQLQELEHFANQWNLVILATPKALLINNLPEKLKSQVLENFKGIQKSRFYKKDPIFKNRVDAVKLAILQPGDDQLLATFIAELDQRRNINHETYLGVKLT